MIRLLACSASCLPILIKASVIPVSNSVSTAPISDGPSQSEDCSVLGSRNIGHEGPFDDLNLTSSLPFLNASLVGPEWNDDWHADYYVLGGQICATAVLVDTAHALAKMALYDLLSEETFIVDKYKEVQIKVTQFKAGFTRIRAALSLYDATQQMTGTNSFLASRFTFFNGKVKMGRIDFTGTACSSGSCRANSANASLPVAVSSNDSSIVVTGNKAGSLRSAVPTLVNVFNNKNSDMELDCRWYGQNIGQKIAMLAPSSALTYSHIAKEDPMSLLVLKDVLNDRILDVTVVLLATPHPSPLAPLWSYYWAIQALGQMPEKMADQWDWREMTMKVMVDDLQIGTIDLIKGVSRRVSGPSLGSENGSIFVTQRF